MQQLHTSIHIDAPAPVIWEVLTDFDRYPYWNPFVTEIRGPQLVGEQLTVTIKPEGKRAMTMRPHVRVFDPVREFRWRGQLGIGGLFDGEHRFEIEPVATGGCDFVHAERFSGVLVPLLWPLLRRSTTAGFLAMNAALKARAEGLHAERDRGDVRYV